MMCISKRTTRKFNHQAKQTYIKKEKRRDERRKADERSAQESSSKENIPPKKFCPFYRVTLAIVFNLCYSMILDLFQQSDKVRKVWTQIDKV